MKKQLFILFFVLATQPAYALDIGGMIGSAKESANKYACADKALAIVKDGGEKALILFAEVKAGQNITVPSLKDNEILINNVKTYVENGCAKDHLEAAIKTLQAQ